MNFSKSKFLIFLLISIVTITFAIIYNFKSQNEYSTSISILVILSLTIFGFFFLKKHKILFEPIFLFSAYYITIVLVGLYCVHTDFNTVIFVNNTSFFSEKISVLTSYAMFYYLLGYIFTLIGYYSFRHRDPSIEIKFENKLKINDKVLNVVILIYLSIGLMNFAINVIIFAAGNILIYLTNISIRHLEFANGGTTLGYIFGYTGMYVWLYKISRQNKKWPISFIFILIITIIMKGSTGRIFDTLVYTSSFVAIYYFLELSRNQKNKNLKYYFFGGFIVLFGVVFYFLRILSSLWYNNMMFNSLKETFLELISKLMFYAIDKGNLPNIFIFLKIIDGWKNDIGYLYGQSLLTWIFNILPGLIRPEGYQPSVMIKKTWYSQIQGGNLPPTGVGEMYANFGWIGPIFGMFIFGVFASVLFNLMKKSKNYWVLVIYIQISLGFIMLYPKGEMDNLSFWNVIPIAFTVLIINMVSSILKKKL